MCVLVEATEFTMFVEQIALTHKAGPITIDGVRRACISPNFNFFIDI